MTFIVDSMEISGIRTDTEDVLEVEAIIAREMVQDYPRKDAKIYKPASELKNATFTADGAFVSEGHPGRGISGIVTEPGEIAGFVSEPEFLEDEAAIEATLQLHKEKVSDETIEGIKDGELTDVSIGFHTSEKFMSGEFDGEKYERMHTDIVIDHVALAPPGKSGRCSPEDGCGIMANADQIPSAVADLFVTDEKYSGYPKAAEENAQMALDARDDTGNPNNCGTDTGWKRAKQLANGKALTAREVGKMSAFNRHRGNKKQGEEGRENCGWMMWKAWGGDEGVDWAQDKLEEINSEADIAVADGEAGEEAMEILQDSGIPVEKRPCNCGDHHSHITVGVASGPEGTSGDFNNDSSENSTQEDKTMSDQTIHDFEDDTVKEHSAVQDIIEEKEEIEETVNDLEEEKEALEEKVNDLEEEKEELEETVQDFQEKKLEEKREQILNDYPVKEEKVSEMDMDDLESLEETLDVENDTSDDGTEGTTVETDTNTNQNQNTEDSGPLQPENARKMEA